MILDYSQYVEVVAREADAVAYPYYPSDGELQRVAPRLLSRFHDVSQVVPPSLSAFLLERLGQQDLSRLLESRVALFDAIEELTVLRSEGSIHRSLVEWLGSACYVCRAPTTVVRDEATDSRIPHVRVRACPTCGWWESENHALLIAGAGRSYNSFTLLRRACLHEFAIMDDDAPLDALRAHFIRHPDDLNRISPRKLELLVGSVLADFMSCEVIHVGGPNDGGYDLLLLMGDTPALVQVKQRVNPRKTEPVVSIREFLGAMILANRRAGLFVSTARRFSPQAKTAARKATAAAVDRLDLIDASKLMDILKLVTERADPWRLHAHSLADEVQGFTLDQHVKFMSF